MICLNNSDNVLAYQEADRSKLLKLERPQSERPTMLSASNVQLMKDACSHGDTDFVGAERLVVGAVGVGRKVHARVPANSEAV